jgi:hypothetical protein
LNRITISRLKKNILAKDTTHPKPTTDSGRNNSANKIPESKMDYLSKDAKKLMKEYKFDLMKPPAPAIPNSEKGLVKITGYDTYTNFIMNKSVSSGWDPNAAPHPSTSKAKGPLNFDPKKKIQPITNRKNSRHSNLDFLRRSIRKNSLATDGEKIENIVFSRTRDNKISNLLRNEKLNRTYDENFCRKGTRPDDKKPWIPFDSQSFNWDMFKDERIGADDEWWGKRAGRDRADGGS